MKRYPSGRFALAVLFPLLLLLQSCSSTSVLGLSRSAYVEELETRLDQQSLRSSRMEEELEVVRNRDEGRMVSAEENIALLTERLEEIDSIRQDMDSLTSGLNASREETGELQKKADEFAQRLDRVHEETLVLLIRALENYISLEEDQKVSLSSR